MILPRPDAPQAPCSPFPRPATDSVPSKPIKHLDPIQAVAVSDVYSGSVHPMREVTRSVAFDKGWSPDRLESVKGLFDGLASEWTASRNDPDRSLPLLDALERGKVEGRLALELGAGTCLFTGALCSRFASVIALDLAPEMLSHAVTDKAPLVNADSSMLPFRDGVADVIVLVNMLLFPTEVERCLAPGGRIVWVSSRAEDTPIHLSAEDLEAAMSTTRTTTWTGVSSRAWTGSWCVLRRT